MQQPPVQLTMEDMEIIHRLNWPSAEELDFDLLKRKRIDSWVWVFFSGKNSELENQHV